MTTPEILQQLRKEIPFKWKVQTAKHWGCECVSYIDARQVMDLLDEVVGPQNWQDHYREVAGKVYCDLSIRVGEHDFITKSDCGTASNFEADKGQASDAFKRAAVKWGIGRFLYQISTVRTKSIEVGKDDRGNPRFFPADEQGQRIYNLTGYINNIQARKKPEPPPEKKQAAQRVPAGPALAGPVLASAPVSTEHQRPVTDTQTGEIELLSNSLAWSQKELIIWLRKNYQIQAWKDLDAKTAGQVIPHLEQLCEEHREALEA